MKILCIGAHPDDIEFAIGGTLQKHLIKGDTIRCLILSDGERDNEGYHVHSEKRRKESTNALNCLGITDISFFDLKEITNSPPIIVLIEKEIRKLNPDRIYTHTIHDRHQEHRKVFEIVQSVGRYIREILLFEVYSSTGEFKPNYFIEYSEEILQKKITALKFHKSQFESNNIILDKIITANSIFRAYSNYGGRKEFLPYVEAFELLKIFRPNNEI